MPWGKVPILLITIFVKQQIQRCHVVEFKSSLFIYSFHKIGLVVKFVDFQFLDNQHANPEIPCGNVPFLLVPDSELYFVSQFSASFPATVMSL